MTYRSGYMLLGDVPTVPLAVDPSIPSPTTVTDLVLDPLRRFGLPPGNSNQAAAVDGGLSLGEWLALGAVAGFVLLYPPRGRRR